MLSVNVQLFCPVAHELAITFLCSFVSQVGLRNAIFFFSSNCSSAESDRGQECRTRHLSSERLGVAQLAKLA